MSWWNQPGTADLDGILCDGAVRSGKTLALTCGFFLWSMSRFDKQVFALCGKTVSSLRRNLILPAQDWLGGLLQITENRAENKLTVRLGNRCNTYYLFGGQDESSYMLIQGITLAGVLLDEVVLMPRSFVEQAAARCSVAGAKLWFSCNPASPEHWFYREWVCKTAEKRLLRLHFTMADNPALPEAVKARYRRLYTGVFYRRYVLGQWCAAEGRIYDFDPERHTVEIMQNAICSHPERSEGSPSMVRKARRGGSFAGAQDDTENVKYYISVDYGVHNPFSAGLWAVYDRGVLPPPLRGTPLINAGGKLPPPLRGTPLINAGGKLPLAEGAQRREQAPALRDGAVAVRLREFYHDGRATGQLLTDEEYHAALETLAGDLPIERVIVDPSAAGFIALLRKRKRFRVRRADNRVLPGIRLVGSLLAEGRLLIGKTCKDAIREFSLYVWQDDTAKDAPHKENDHAMDDIRYFCMSAMRNAKR